MLTTPAMIAVYLGIPIFLFQINIPFPIKNAAQMIGNMTTPLAMIIIGAIIESANIKGFIRYTSLYFEYYATAYYAANSIFFNFVHRYTKDSF